MLLCYYATMLPCHYIWCRCRGVRGQVCLLLQGGLAHYYRVTSPITTGLPRLLIQGDLAYYYRVASPITTGFSCLLLQGYLAYYYRVILPITTGLSCPLLQGYLACYYRIASQITTGLPRLSLQGYLLALADVAEARSALGVGFRSQGPQKALCGGIPDPYLEPLTRTWSHFVGIYRQKLMKYSKNDFGLRVPSALRGWGVGFGCRG